MGHAVLELVKKTILSEFARLEVDLVLQSGIVTEGDLFPGLFLAHPVFLLERIEGADGRGDIRQGESVGGIPGVVAVQGVDREIHLASEIAGKGDGRGNLVLQGLVYRVGIVLAVGRTGEVHRS